MEREPNSMNGTPPNERVEIDLSSSAAVALVCVSTVFCCLLILVYCHCYCNEDSSGDHEPANWSLFGKWWRKLRSPLPLPLPLVSYRKKADEITVGCVVCLNEFEDKEEVKIIPGCGHVFHPECIDRWLAAHRSCPVCRCSRIFGGGGGGEGGGREEEAVVEIGEGVEEEVEGGVMEREVARMERSRSWSSREVDVDDDDEDNGGGGIRVGLRRTCSV